MKIVSYKILAELHCKKIREKIKMYLYRFSIHGFIPEKNLKVRLANFASFAYALWSSHVKLLIIYISNNCNTKIQEKYAFFFMVQRLKSFT